MKSRRLRWEKFAVVVMLAFGGMTMLFTALGALGQTVQSPPPSLPAARTTAETTEAIRAATKAAAEEPLAEYPTRVLIDELSKAGRKPEALAVANQFAARGKPSGLLLAQRGFLRRELGEFQGAIDDFTAALASAEVSSEQKPNLDKAITEARTARNQRDIDQANAAFTQGDFDRAIALARSVLANDPQSIPAVIVLIDALSRSGQKTQAISEADKLVARDPNASAARAQRGYLRRELSDPTGAIEDFTVALQAPTLPAAQRQNLEAALAEAETALVQVQIDEAQTALNKGNFKAASEIIDGVLRRSPNAEPAWRIRIEILSRTRRKKEALALADRAIAGGSPSGLMLAQRGYLRRELGNSRGAIEDFTQAINTGELTPGERANIEKAIEEARGGGGQVTPLQQAQVALNRGQYDRAAAIAGTILRREPNSQAALRLRFDALSRAGRTKEAIADADRLISRGYAPGWVLAQRGYLRRSAGDLAGAVQDFDAALGRGDLSADARANLAYIRTETAAALAEANGRPDEAANVYAQFLQTQPTRSEAWYSYGYVLMKNKRKQEGASAIQRGIALKPVGSAYLDAASAYILTNAPLASTLYRQGLDRWYARDPSLARRSNRDLEQIKNEVVEADASVRTNVGYGGIASRPIAAGGRSNTFAAESRVRFDGRYLASVPGLEFVLRGFHGRDALDTEETALGAGLRYRLFRAVDLYHEVDLYVGAMVDHFFQPDSETQVVPVWGLGLGSNPYPYDPGWVWYWDLGAFGAYRTAEGRTLQDFRGNLGFMYNIPGTARAAIGPTVLAVVGYDSKSDHAWAAGIGPSVMARFWLGGDRYRSYDAILTLQAGYLFDLGGDERQRGWRGQIGLTF